MRRSPTRRRFLAGTAGTLAAAGGGMAAAEATPTGGDAAPTSSDPPSPVATSQADTDLEALVDDLVESSLADHGVPGATAAVVADGDAFATGYGVADRESGEPVDAQTPFRVGSVSKPVVATALMARIQAGDLDPEVPVSTYVDGLGEAGDPTLAELVTHRGGFEHTNRGLWVSDPEDLRPLPEALRSRPHARVRPPGEAPAYSNYGYAVAGSALAAVADAPFREAVAGDLLEPAGMTTSSFRQPLPSSLAEAHSTGYGPLGATAAGEFPYAGFAPPGALSTTAADMARFMQLHLDDGVVDGQRVLAAETVAACHRQWATAHERLPGMAFGFVEGEHGGVRTLRHNGATPAFYADLLLVPERDLGVFLAYNSPSGAAAVEDVLSGLRAELLPEPEPASLSPDGRPTRADDLGGTYRSLRRSWEWHDRVTTTVQAPTVDVSVAENGALTTTGGSVTRRWVEVEPLVFERVDGSERLAFETDADGDIAYLHRGGNPTAAYDHVAGTDRLAVHAVLAAVSVVALLSAVVGWPAASAVRAVTGDGDGVAVDPRTWPSRPAILARAVAVGGALAALAFPVAVVMYLAAAPSAVLSVPPPTFAALFALPLSAAAATAATLWFAVRSWRAGYWGPLARVHYALVAAALVAVCWLLWYWNLLVPPS